MFEGSENIPRGRVDKLISGAGGNLNASTSFDFTDYQFNLPSNQLALALWIESERMLHAKVDETGVETQRQVVKEERRRGIENRPYGTLFENLAAMVFEGSPYEWTPIGSAQYIDQAKIEEFRDFYKRYYVPNNATLVVAGDFQIEEAKRLIENYFGDIPRGPEIPRPEVTLAPQTGPKLQVIEKENTPLPASLHAWRGPTETSPDAYALDLVTNILATGRSSRPANEDAKRLSSQTLLLCEFLVQKAPDFVPPQLPRKALVHGHCHHKSILKMGAEQRLLDKLGLDYEILDSGCCGMAGSFGFEKDKQAISIACGERVLLPAVRQAAEDTLIIADGFSCREQIAQCTERRAMHIAEIMQLALAQPRRANR